MKAIVLREFGGPEVLRLEEVPTPEPGAGEVLVRVHAVSVNRTLDLVVRTGSYQRPVKLPHVLGADPSGLVERVGEGVTTPRVRDRVAIISSVRCGTCEHCRADEEADCTRGESIGVQRWGGYAEYVVAPAGNAYVIPESLSFPEATVVSRHASAAHHMLATRAGLRAGERILITGAAGALGSMAVQVAKLLGATVVAGAGADERVAAARALGADFGVNYRRDDLAAEVARLTDGRGVDAVLETTGDPEIWPRAFASLVANGRLISCGGHGGGVVPLDVRKLYLRRLRVLGAAGANRADVEWALRAAAAGRLRAAIARALPLREAAEAHRIVERNAVLGKVILDPSDGLGLP